MDWDSLEKPWSREECRDRYVQGRQVSLRELAELSGVSFKTIAEWSRFDAWVEQRRRVQNEIRAKTDALVGDAIAASNAERLKAHLKAYQDVADLGLSLIGLAQQCANDLANDKNKSVNPYQLQALASSSSQAASVVKTAIDGQRQALWMDLENINHAIAVVEKHGYHVSEGDPKDTQEDQVEDNKPAIEVTAEDVPPTP